MSYSNIFQHIPSISRELVRFQGAPHNPANELKAAGSREWWTCWAREAARKTLGSPNGVSFWSGKGWGFFWSEIPQVVKWCRNHGRNDAVCQALWYGVRFLQQLILNCILFPSWQSTGVNQPSTWISTADAQDKSPDTPKWASSS